MVGGFSEVQLRAQVRLACGRIAGGAAAIVEAHNQGVAAGPHEKPWTSDYHREAVRIYSESLRQSYQRDIGVLFGRCVETMAEGSIPARMAKDWAIVTDYLRCASAAIAEHLDSPDAEPRLSDAVSMDIEGRDSPPLVIRFDALTRLTTSDGARRLEQAAVAVREHLDDLPHEMLDDRERLMLKRLVAGTAMVDLAAEMNYSERSIYRSLTKLWEKLGVPNREGGVHKAVSEGLLD